MRKVLGAKVGSESQSQHRPGTLAELREPVRAASAQQAQEDHELQRRDKFLGRGKLPFLAGLFQAPLGGLLALSGFVRHDASYPLVHIPKTRYAVVQAWPASSVMIRGNS